MYMLKTNVEEKIRNFVKNGGSFVATYLFAVADKDDMVYYGGLPANGLKEVFGIWAEESDGIPEGREGTAEYNKKEYKTQHICDVIHSKGAEVLGTYTSDFYAGEPSVTRNSYGKGKAYYAAFRNDGDFADDFCSDLIKELCIKPPTDIIFPRDIIIRKRGELIFILNFTDEEKAVTLDKTYYDILSETDVNGILTIPEDGYCILKQKEILK